MTGDFICPECGNCYFRISITEVSIAQWNYKRPNIWGYCISCCYETSSGPYTVATYDKRLRAKVRDVVARFLSNHRNTGGKIPTVEEFRTKARSYENLQEGIECAIVLWSHFIERVNKSKRTNETTVPLEILG